MLVCRSVTLVLVDRYGAVLGALPPVDVAIPYWPEVASVIDAVREVFELEVTILRLLAAERPVPHGGAVTYLAEVVDGTPRNLDAAGVLIAGHPLRAEYAEVGGPAASIQWAAGALDASGRGPVTHVAQQRTWNLSAIWRLQTPAGPTWLKHVPRFFWHESQALRWAAGNGHGEAVPTVIGAHDGRMLLDHIPGEDLYEADADTCDAIAADLHRLQITGMAAANTLIARGVPDRRFPALRPVLADLVAQHGSGSPYLDTLLAELEDRFAETAATGLPDTLVHGDLHPGNVRSDGRRRVLIDWGDSFVGNPVFDILRLTDGHPEAASLIDAWVTRWRATIPHSDPRAAVELLKPVAALRNAAVYAQFLANIEPSEHPYHASDVGFWLDRAASHPTEQDA